MHTEKFAKVLLYGLDDRLAEELNSALHGLAVTLRAESAHDVSQCLDTRESPAPQLIFCSFENGLESMLHAVSGHGRGVPVIAVSRHAEVHHWIDAIEAGAADYCAAPFESGHMRWLLQSNIHAPVKAA